MAYLFIEGNQKMKRMGSIIWSFAILLIFSTFSEGQNHFITDSGYRAKVEAQFEKQKTLAQNRSEQLFTVFNQSLSAEEKEALQFLYAFMPLNDLADYHGEFFLQQVKIALEAKRTFPWGRTIPEDIFLHFVLPYRVNTENPDSSRVVFFHELKDRIKSMSMKDAILEINHWCHEKVTYQSTDRRTSAPLATIKAVYGRCGEETVFTIAALRAAGIPARQCYVPRWAHTESNHAWVEVWIDGKWHYFGACEPEPDLNMAWFTEPVKRAMLLSSIVPGNYEGPEVVTEKEEHYTKINNLAMYAPAKELFVRILDKEEKTVENASVEFQIFNSGQFASLATKNTNKNGLCSLTLGYGDILIWASSGNDFGYKKVSVREIDTVKVTLNRDPGKSYTESITMNPPPVQKPTPVSEEGREENTRRLKYEDSLRNVYTATFIDSAASYRLALDLKLDPENVWKVLKESRGNWKEIVEFLKSAPPEQIKWVLAMLSTVSEKDLHDTGINVFIDHLSNSFKYKNDIQGVSDEDFTRYVLSPKVSSEILTAYKSYFQNKFNADFIKKAQTDISVIINWMKSTIRIDDTANYYEVPITPRGVYELKVSDSNSRSILFVALCRSFGIPSRMSFASRNPEYFMDNAWHETNFENSEKQNPVKGYVTLNNVNKDLSSAPPSFMNHRFLKFSNGVYAPVFFGNREGRMGRTNRRSDFSKPQETGHGNYLLLTANRLENGTALVNLSFFNVREGQTTVVDLDIPTRKTESKIYGKLDLNNAIVLLDSKEKITLKSKISKNGLLLAWIDPDKEPTKHAMGDFQSLKMELEKLDVNLIFLLQRDNVSSSFDPGTYDLPKKHCFAFTNNELLKTGEISTSSNLPVIMVSNENGDIIYLSEGYRIGIGEEVIKSFNAIH